MERKGSRNTGAVMPDPLYSLPEVKKVLVLAPHPDDETIGCGGTIALYAINDAEVYVAVVSDGGKISDVSAGESIDIVEMRKQESNEASKILGIKQTYFLGFPDGKLESYKDEIKGKIEDIVVKFQPDIIFSPSPLDYHADHMAISEVALLLLNRMPGLMVAFFGIYETVRFNLLVDITDVLHLKEKAILSYKYSLFGCPGVFVEAVKGFNIFNAFHTRQKRYYEAFYLVSKPVDKTEIIDWLTYGTKAGDPAAIFLSKIKVVDELLFEFKKCAVLLKSKEAEIQELKAVIENKEKEVGELETKLDCMTGRFMWELAIRFYKFRDKMLPEGSNPRKLYNKIVSYVKFYSSK
jgi:LmbE family N-acetylglucosaminyl deacetylase